MPVTERIMSPKFTDDAGVKIPLALEPMGDCALSRSAFYLSRRPYEHCWEMALVARQHAFEFLCCSVVLVAAIDGVGIIHYLAGLPPLRHARYVTSAIASPHMPPRPPSY